MEGSEESEGWRSRGVEGGDGVEGLGGEVSGSGGPGGCGDVCVGERAVDGGVGEIFG